MSDDQPFSPNRRYDVIAGITAAAVVLPKAMAYATVAGLPVAVGLYTAFIPMIVVRLPRLVARAQRQFDYNDRDPHRPDSPRGTGRRSARLVTATATLTALVRFVLLLARLLRLGFVANFISAPVLTGFKAGIGLVIVLDQVPKLVGCISRRTSSTTCSVWSGMRRERPGRRSRSPRSR